MADSNGAAAHELPPDYSQNDALHDLLTVVLASFPAKPADPAISEAFGRLVAWVDGQPKHGADPERKVVDTRGLSTPHTAPKHARHK